MINDTVSFKAPTHRLGLEDIELTGALDDAAEKIAGNQPISDVDFKTLVVSLQDANSKQTRMNGIINNVTKVVQVVRTTILPLVAGAL